jgi:hypothetical protein
MTVRKKNKSWSVAGDVNIGGCVTDEEGKDTPVIRGNKFSSPNSIILLGTRGML